MKCASVGGEGWRTMGVVGRDNAMKCANVRGEGLEDNGGCWSGQWKRLLTQWAHIFAVCSARVPWEFERKQRFGRLWPVWGREVRGMGYA